MPETEDDLEPLDLDHDEIPDYRWRREATMDALDRVVLDAGRWYWRLPMLLWAALGCVWILVLLLSVGVKHGAAESARITERLENAQPATPRDGDYQAWKTQIQAAPDWDAFTDRYDLVEALRHETFSAEKLSAWEDTAVATAQWHRQLAVHTDLAPRRGVYRELEVHLGRALRDLRVYPAWLITTRRLDELEAYLGHLEHLAGLYATHDLDRKELSSYDSLWETSYQIRIAAMVTLGPELDRSRLERWRDAAQTLPPAPDRAPALREEFDLEYAGAIDSDEYPRDLQAIVPGDGIQLIAADVERSRRHLQPMLEIVGSGSFLEADLDPEKHRRPDPWWWGMAPPAHQSCMRAVRLARSAQTSALRLEWRRRLTVIGARALLYHHDHGRYPASLDELGADLAAWRQTPRQEALAIFPDAEEGWIAGYMEPYRFSNPGRSNDTVILPRRAPAAPTDGAP